MWISNQRIADSLNISRQAVSKHRKNGMPCDSIESAQAWYSSNVSYSRRKGVVSYYTPQDALRAVHISPEETADFIKEFSDASLEESDLEEPMTLDDYPPGFWGVDASASIARILLGRRKKVESPEEVFCVFHCIAAAMRRHLRDMPERIAKRIGGPQAQRIEDTLFEWVEMFCAHWHGAEFRDAPMLPKGAMRLEDFYRDMGKEGLPPIEDSESLYASEVLETDRCV